MEKEPVPTSKPSPSRRLFLFFRKILLWSLLLWGLNFLFTKIGWDSWEKFADSSTRVVNGLAGRAFMLSPLVLWSEIKQEKFVQIPDPDAVTVPAHTIRVRSPYSWQDSVDQKVPAYHPRITHKVTIKEKVFAWARGFWYKPDGSPHWFGRILLGITIILAFASKNSPGSQDTTPWPMRFLMILVMLPIGLFLLYLLLKLLVFLVGAIVALFSSIMALGGFARYVVEELRSEAADESKKTVLSVVFPFLFKKK
jgi:hypothetical protein